MAAIKLRSIPLDLTMASIALTNSGDLVALVTGKKIIVWRLVFTVSDPTKTVKLQSGGSTDLTGAMLLSAVDLEAIPVAASGIGPCAIPVCETASGEKLNIVASSAVNISGWIVYSTADNL